MESSIIKSVYLNDNVSVEDIFENRFYGHIIVEINALKECIKDYIS